MNFKPGDKVWVDWEPLVQAGSLPAGRHAAVTGYALPPSNDAYCVFNRAHTLWWIQAEGADRPYMACECNLTLRDDQPPQQEPKQQREPVGEWDLCPWRPKRITRVFPTQYVTDNWRKWGEGAKP